MSNLLLQLDCYRFELAVVGWNPSALPGGNGEPAFFAWHRAVPYRAVFVNTKATETQSAGTKVLITALYFTQGH